MDDEQLQAQVNQYRGVLARVQAELAQRLAGNRPEDIAKAKADLHRYEAQLQEARSRLLASCKRVSRKRFPAEQGAISRDSLDESLTEERNARDNLNQVQASLAVAQQELLRQRNGYRVEEIAQSRAQVSEAMSQLQVCDVLPALQYTRQRGLLISRPEISCFNMYYLDFRPRHYPMECRRTEYLPGEPPPQQAFCL